MSKNKQFTPDPNFKGFIDVDLTAEQRASLKKKPFDLSAVDDVLLKLCEAGYKMTFGYDAYNSAYSCFLRQTDAKGENFGWVLTGRGSTPIKALKQAAYKHFELYDEVWPKLLEKSRSEIDD